MVSFSNCGLYSALPYSLDGNIAGIFHNKNTMHEIAYVEKGWNFSQ